ncbi:MAG: lycopene cyclase domain-containing protein [Methylophaga sp.]|jgi:hypothetical protein|uniref:lycopene cyclase domain-containing protein n=1 Tax=Methylophaga sp. TaxID=2024840 RepID=UPI00299E5E3B|nr:lycopene cyclase domain-containing protein [Methylophaga sp.]MDX1751251.1 lycopene cyclase domain-containing protein [Methylophaga sp.]|tara:strand:+ start:10047 stop:10739 length:693 start_codon:yes stop_codon:yes gene_type:complete
MNVQYIWLAWSISFLIPWLVVYKLAPDHRTVMLKASLITMLFGFTEPLFVPEYWSPPSLFNLAIETGFDIESLIFCFGIGGIGAVFYNVITGQRLQVIPLSERLSKIHNYHGLALMTPFIVFPIMMLWDWNPIYPAILSMIVGGITNSLCRPDIAVKSFWGGTIFLAYYTIFVFGLELLVPGYIETVWNLAALSGLFFIGIPMEELLFAVSFGYYWTGVYEHLTWKQTAS